MGYRMDYGAWNERTVYKRYSSGRKYLLLLLIPAMILCAIYKERFISLIFPGDQDTTKEAIDTFISSMKEGERVTDAFGSFCKVILNESNVS